MKKLFFAIVSLLGTIFGVMVVPASAASFDCTKASTWVEKTVCSQSKLSKSDEVVAQKYKAKLATATEYEDSNAFRIAARNDQRNWIKFQRNTCNSEQCLIREYKERNGDNIKSIGSYQGNLDLAKWPTGLPYGTFFEETDIAVYDVETKTWDDPIVATNSITIRSIQDQPNMALIDGMLIFTNAHTCHIDSETATWFQNHWVINAHQDTGAGLRVYPVSSGGKTQILLKDVDNQYKQNHCGLRGYLDSKILTTK